MQKNFNSLLEQVNYDVVNIRNLFKVLLLLLKIKCKLIKK